ncbi:DNA adenine methylase [Sphingobacterium spiritivorum]|uniref:DNA adenine methylase n=1 Tax=Sphingobacterium spiritivorum TaxID=258 RepID=UPI003DA52B09
MQIFENKVEPFLKWAGGKRWLISKYKDILLEIGSYNNYFEPFLGGGAVFFHLNPRSGMISDVNADLVNTYKVIKNYKDDLYELLSNYQSLHSKDFYYEMRASQPEESIFKAARFLYLNRTCWNGLYRVNNKGQFNVPIGTKTKVLFENEDFREIASRLNNVEIMECDFEVTMDKAESGDFLFVDPPYTVKHNNNGFVKYNENIFSWKDQIRLKETVVRCIERGVKVLVTNANHQSVLDLYSNIGQTLALDRPSIIAGKKEKRGIFNELIIKCW